MECLRAESDDFSPSSVMQIWNPVEMEKRPRHSRLLSSQQKSWLELCHFLHGVYSISGRVGSEWWWFLHWNVSFALEKCLRWDWKCLCCCCSCLRTQDFEKWASWSDWLWLSKTHSCKSSNHSKQISFGAESCHYFTPIKKQFFSWPDTRQPRLGLNYGIVGLAKKQQQRLCVDEAEDNGLEWRAWATKTSSSSRKTLKQDALDLKQPQLAGQGILPHKPEINSRDELRLVFKLELKTLPQRFERSPSVRIEIYVAMSGYHLLLWQDFRLSSGTNNLERCQEQSRFHLHQMTDPKQLGKLIQVFFAEFLTKIDNSNARQNCLIS